MKRVTLVVGEGSSGWTGGVPGGTKGPLLVSSAGSSLMLASRSPEETKAVGAALSGVVEPGEVVVLEGDLGAGKTTLVQGFAAALAVSEPVTSPTFTLLRPYEAYGECGPLTLWHADLYRMEQMTEVFELGLDELLEDRGIALVEWGDRAAGALVDDPVVVRIEQGDEPGARLVSITFADLPSVAGRVEELRERLLAEGRRS